MEHDAYARELAVLYGVDPNLPYSNLLEEFKKILDKKRSNLQKLYKMKAGVQKIQDSATIDRRSSRTTTTDVIKELNVDVQDLTQDIGDLETSLLYLKHSAVNADKTTSTLTGSVSNENNVDSKLAELQKALELELQVKSGAQRLIDTYKTGPRQNVTILEEAKRQYDIANNKIGFIRNQLIRVKQHSENAQQPFGRLSPDNNWPQFLWVHSTGDSATKRLGNQSSHVSLSDFRLSNGASHGSSVHLSSRDPTVLWKAKVIELAYRCRVERALLDGSRKAVRALLDTQSHVDKSMKNRALQNARESLHKLHLFQLGLRKLIDSPPSAADECKTISNDPEIPALLASPWTLTDASRANRGSLQNPTAPTAVTGSLEVRCVGCQDILDSFPSELVHNELTGCASGASGNLVRELTSQYSDGHWADVRCCLLLDNKLVWESNWRPPGQQCWESRTTFNVDRAKELQVQVFWKRMFSPTGSPGQGSTAHLGPSSSSSSLSKSSSTDETNSGLEWVLGAVTYLRLEDFLGCHACPLELEMTPKGTVFLVLKFTDPLLTKPRARLRRQKRLFSKQKGRDIPRSSELNINVRLWTRMLGSGQLLGLNRTPATGSATFSQTNSEILSTSGAPTAVSVMGREGRYHPLNTSLTEPRQTNASTQVTSNRSSLTLTQLASRISHISNNEPNKSSHRRSSTISFSSILPRRRVSQPPYYITVRSPEVQSMTEPNADRQPEPFHFIFVPCERSSSTLSQSSDVSGQGPHRAISLTLSRQTSLKPVRESRRLSDTKARSPPAGFPTSPANSSDDRIVIIDRPPAGPTSIPAPNKTTQSTLQPSPSLSSEHTRSSTLRKESNDLSADGVTVDPIFIPPSVPDYDVVPPLSEYDIQEPHLSVNSMRLSDYATLEPAAPASPTDESDNGDHQKRPMPATEQQPSHSVKKLLEPDYTNLRDSSGSTESPAETVGQNDADLDAGSTPVAPPRRTSRLAPNIPGKLIFLTCAPGTLIRLNASNW
ncbi:Protein kinase N [Fasciolopsis buskii]|uniref:Protein kinase N n=1 Tax=Fasciolopsis buskii TaxID=27845 RepID=A0A8E0VLJ0_9TREM|nr:Protein kinase N [Fasciolopsis buski]